MNLIKKINSAIRGKYTTLCQKAGAAQFSPTEKQAKIVLFIFGFSVLALSMSDYSSAAGFGGLTTKYNDERIANAVNAVLTYLEGTFGALIMAAAGIGAILSAAFGQYRAALSLMVVAIGAFILRSLMSTFFNDSGVQQ